MAYKYNGILQNNATAENIVISCSLVLSLFSETEKIGSMINYDRRPRVWLSKNNKHSRCQPQQGGHHK